MDLKCKNCGQMMSEEDKFCRFCGCPAPAKKAEVKLSKKQLIDKAQESKTLVSDEEMDEADVWPIDKLSVKNKGELSANRTKQALVFAVSVIFAVLFAVASIIMLHSGIVSGWGGFFAIFLSIVAIFVALAFGLEGFHKMNMYARLKEEEITVPKYGYKKAPFFLLGGHVFEIECNAACPACDGDITGDLHLEKINGKLVVICNYNRKHFWIVYEKEFIESYYNDYRKSIGMDESAEEFCDNNAGENKAAEENNFIELDIDLQNTENANESAVTENSEETEGSSDSKEQ